MKTSASHGLVYAMLGGITLTTFVIACGGSVEDDGKGGDGGSGSPSSSAQDCSTTKSSSNNVTSSTDANVSTTNGIGTTTAMCGPGAQTTAQTGGFLQCFYVSQLPCPSQDEAECYLNRDCEPGEEGYDVVGGPNSPTANTNSTAGGGPDICCYSTQGFACGFIPGSSGSGFPTSSTGGSGSGGFPSSSGSGGFPSSNGSGY